MINELRSAVNDTLLALSGLAESSLELTWAPTDGMLPVIRSAILRRQYECLCIVVELVDKEQGFAAVGLLRPACEEFLWAKYLASLRRKDADELLELMARKEIADSLKAQDDYAGRTASQSLGLKGYVKQHEASSKHIAANIRTLGAKLKWEKRTYDAGKLPSVAFIARTVGETKLYRFLYHASSRYVHFSPAELLRRAWGRSGEFTVTSNHLTDYWGEFVLYWGAYLMIFTIPEVCEFDAERSIKDTWDGEKLQEAVGRIHRYGPVSIITAKELAWG